MWSFEGWKGKTFFCMLPIWQQNVFPVINVIHQFTQECQIFERMVPAGTVWQLRSQLHFEKHWTCQPEVLRKLEQYWFYTQEFQVYRVVPSLLTLVHFFASLVLFCCWPEIHAITCTSEGKYFFLVSSEKREMGKKELTFKGRRGEKRFWRKN